MQIYYAIMFYVQGDLSMVYACEIVPADASGYVTDRWEDSSRRRNRL